MTGELPTNTQDARPFSQELLAEFLLQQGLIGAEQLAHAREHLAKADAPDHITHTAAFVPSADGKSLHAISPKTGETIKTLELVAGDPGDGAFQPVGWTRYCDGAILILEPGDPAGSRKWFPTDHAPRLGLIPTARGGFLYIGEEPRRSLSPSLSNLPSPWLNPPGASGPVDLICAPHGEFVVAVNRGLGTLHVVLTASLEQRGAIALRPAGHTCGIGCVISPDARTIYATDGLTPRLAIIDVASFKVRHQMFPTGPLGALTLSPDGTRLLVCFVKGPSELGMIALSAPDLRVKHTVNLPGKGIGDRPLNALVGTDEDPYIFLLAYAPDTRESHHLLVFDRTRQHRLVHQTTLKTMPLTLGFPAPATWCPEPPDLGDVLVEMGLLSRENVAAARMQVRGEQSTSLLSLQTVPINPAIVAQLPERLIRERDCLPLNLLNGEFIVATSKPQDPKVLQFAKDLAQDARLVVLPLTPGEFEAFLDERYPRLLEQHFVQVETGGTPKPPPPVTPSATVRVGAVVNVSTTTKSPGQGEPHRSRVADDWGQLAGDRFLLINPLKRQVAEMDRTGMVHWSYQPEGDTLARQFTGFAHAARLGNGHTLVVDVGGNRVVELTNQRTAVWHSRDDAKLKAPRHALRLANGHTLVTDTGHNRIVELDAEGRAVFSHGEMGCSGTGLFKPVYCDVLGHGRYLVTDGGNHRVIEVDVTKGIVWQYGNAGNRLGSGQGSAVNQLDDPGSSVRLLDGNTLIADTGNQRVLEIDLLGQIIWTYKPSLVQGGLGVRDPHLVKRLASGNTLIAGRQGLCEVTPDLHIVWEYHLIPPNVSARTTVTLTQGAPKANSQPLTVCAESETPIQLPSRFLHADRQSNRVWELDRQKQLTWQFSGLNTHLGNQLALDRPHYVKRLRNGNTLITDTGNHRVLEVNPQGQTIWEFGQAGKLGTGSQSLANPRSAERLTNGHTVIADQSNRRIVVVNERSELVWRFDGAKTPLYAPTYATLLPGGNVLIVDWGGHTVLEFNAQGKLVWFYGQMGRSGVEPGLLSHPEHASRLSNGNTLIADTQNHRVIEVNPERELTWQYGGNAECWPTVGRFGLQMLTPVAAWLLPDGHIVVHHAGQGRIVEVNRSRQVVFQYAP